MKKEKKEYTKKLKKKIHEIVFFIHLQLLLFFIVLYSDRYPIIWIVYQFLLFKNNNFRFLSNPCLLESDFVIGSFFPFTKNTLLLNWNKDRFLYPYRRKKVSYTDCFFEFPNRIRFLHR